MSEKLSLGYSPCPNDTFIFYALTHGHVTLQRGRLQRPVLEDVETLNRWAMEGRLDITKLSFHALGHVQNTYTMLSAGAALGRGCGPLLVTRRDINSSNPADWRIAVPGPYTTAALLLKLFLPEHEQVVSMRFDAIMAAVAAGEVEGGVIIHESRFMYRQHGLVKVQDLGQWWEEDTGLPIPLGCIAVRKNLPQSVFEATQDGIRRSIQWASRHQGRADRYIRQHAQELDNQVIASHIRLYVNDFSVDIGQEGREAVEELFRRGSAVGALPENRHLT